MHKVVLVSEGVLALREVTTLLFLEDALMAEEAPLDEVAWLK